MVEEGATIVEGSGGGGGGDEEGEEGLGVTTFVLCLDSINRSCHSGMTGSVVAIVDVDETLRIIGELAGAAETETLVGIFSHLGVREVGFALGE